MLEIIRGKQTSPMSRADLLERLSTCDRVHLDLGTGDGRFVRQAALACPTCFVIGVDAARENLPDISRRAPANTLFVIANAVALPIALDGLAAHISVNFPWGSLLTGLLTPESAVLAGLVRLARPGARLDIRLNAGALAQAGWTLEDGAAQVRALLSESGFAVEPAAALAAPDLAAFPSTWAKRLAFGRDPRAVVLAALYGERPRRRLAQHARFAADTTVSQRPSTLIVEHELHEGERT